MTLKIWEKLGNGIKTGEKLGNKFTIFSNFFMPKILKIICLTTTNIVVWYIKIINNE